MFNFLRTKEKSPRIVYANDFTKLLTAWKVCLNASGLAVSREAEKEFQKRIKNAEKGEGKPKLNLVSANLTDQHLKCLMEALSTNLVVSKIEVGKGISNESALSILDLLIAQIKIGLGTAVDKRLEMVFLCDISSLSALDESLKDDINLLTGALKIANVKVLIYSAYLKIKSPVAIDSAIFRSLWSSVFGDNPSIKVFAAVLDAQKKPGVNTIPYDVLERTFLEEMERRGSVKMLVTSQKERIAILVKKGVSVDKPSSPFKASNVPSPSAHAITSSGVPSPNGAVSHIEIAETLSVRKFPVGSSSTSRATDVDHPISSTPKMNDYVISLIDAVNVPLTKQSSPASSVAVSEISPKRQSINLPPARVITVPIVETAYESSGDSSAANAMQLGRAFASRPNSFSSTTTVVQRDSFSTTTSRFLTDPTGFAEISSVNKIDRDDYSLQNENPMLRSPPKAGGVSKNKDEVKVVERQNAPVRSDNEDDDDPVSSHPKLLKKFKRIESELAATVKATPKKDAGENSPSSVYGSQEDENVMPRFSLSRVASDGSGLPSSRGATDDRLSRTASHREKMFTSDGEKISTGDSYVSSGPIVAVVPELKKSSSLFAFAAKQSLRDAKSQPPLADMAVVNADMHSDVEAAGMSSEAIKSGVLVTARVVNVPDSDDDELSRSSHPELLRKLKSIESIGRSQILPSSAGKSPSPSLLPFPVVSATSPTLSLPLCASPIKVMDSELASAEVSKSRPARSKDPSANNGALELSQSLTNSAAQPLAPNREFVKINADDISVQSSMSQSTISTKFSTNSRQSGVNKSTSGPRFANNTSSTNHLNRYGIMASSTIINPVLFREQEQKRLEDSSQSLLTSPSGRSKRDVSVVGNGAYRMLIDDEGTTADDDTQVLEAYFDLSSDRFKVAYDNAVKSRCLDISGYGFPFVNLNSLLPEYVLRQLNVLVMRMNMIEDLQRLQLPRLTRQLTDLDLGMNNLSGVLGAGVCPPTILRLDLSGNRITDISSLVECVNMQRLNVSNNRISQIAGLPPALVDLDISDNLINSKCSLRSISSFCNQLQSLILIRNPIVENSSDWRVVVCSTFRRLESIDGVPLPRPSGWLKRQKAVNGREALEKSMRSDAAKVRKPTKAEQEMRDHKRTLHAQYRAKILAEAQAIEHRRSLETTVGHGVTLSPKDIQNLNQRLSYVPRHKKNLSRRYLRHLQEPVIFDIRQSPSRSVTSATRNSNSHTKRSRAFVSMEDPNVYRVRSSVLWGNNSLQSDYEDSIRPDDGYDPHSSRFRDNRFNAEFDIAGRLEDSQARLSPPLLCPSNPESSGLEVDQDDPVTIQAAVIVNRWLNLCDAELSQASELMHQMFEIALDDPVLMTPAGEDGSAQESAKLVSQDAEAVSKEIDKITFARDATLAPELESSIKHFRAIGDSPRLEKISVALTSIVAFSIVLNDVESAVHYCAAHSFNKADLRASLRLIMSTEDGRCVQQKVLSPQGIELPAILADASVVGDTDDHQGALEPLVTDGLSNSSQSSYNLRPVEYMSSTVVAARVSAPISSDITSGTFTDTLLTASAAARSLRTVPAVPHPSTAVINLSNRLSHSDESVYMETLKERLAERARTGTVSPLKSRATHIYRPALLPSSAEHSIAPMSEPTQPSQFAVAIAQKAAEKSQGRARVDSSPPNSPFHVVPSNAKSEAASKPAVQAPMFESSASVADSIKVPEADIVASDIPVTRKYKEEAAMNESSDTVTSKSKARERLEARLKSKKAGAS